MNTNYSNKKWLKRKLLQLSGLAWSLFFSLSTFAQTAENPKCNYLCNGGFETSSPQIGTVSLLNESQIPCWHTTSSDGKMEIWGPLSGVAGYGSGSQQFLEINATEYCTVYQNIVVTPGSIITISFAHRGRAGTDVMKVEAGPVGGPYTDFGNFSDDETAWQYYSVPYSVPYNAGTNYTIRFTSVSAAGGNDGIGNFLDEVVVCWDGKRQLFQEPKCDYICNGTFENSTPLASAYILIDETHLPCWKTTATDGIMEIWGPANGVPAYDGSQFLEINATQAATVYQNIIVTPGSVIDIAFAHRGRDGVDVMKLEAGPLGGPYINLGTFSDDNTAWRHYIVPYAVPYTAGTIYSIRFSSVSATGNNPAIGNFVDKVEVCWDGEMHDPDGPGEPPVYPYPEECNVCSDTYVDHAQLALLNTLGEAAVVFNVNSGTREISKVRVTLLNYNYNLVEPNCTNYCNMNGPDFGHFYEVADPLTGFYSTLLPYNYGSNAPYTNEIEFMTDPAQFINEQLVLKLKFPPLSSNGFCPRTTVSACFRVELIDKDCVVCDKIVCLTSGGDRGTGKDAN